jgi:hypothetical protein
MFQLCTSTYVCTVPLPHFIGLLLWLLHKTLFKAVAVAFVVFVPRKIFAECGLTVRLF